MESDWETEIALAAIAREVLDLKTLQPRGSEWQDTHDYHVKEIKAALVAAYKAGQNSILQTTT